MEKLFYLALLYNKHKIWTFAEINTFFKTLCQMSNTFVALPCAHKFITDALFLLKSGYKKNAVVTWYKSQ